MTRHGHPCLKQDWSNISYSRDQNNTERCGIEKCGIFRKRTKLCEKQYELLLLERFIL